MQFLNYALASIISYFGLVAGMLLIMMGPEEKKAGIKYFILMRNIVLLLIAFFLFCYYSINYYLIFVLMVIALILLFCMNKKIKAEKQYFVYVLLGIIFYLASRDVDFFMVEASLIFVYGLPTGSLLTDSRKKFKSFKKILVYSYFVVITLILPLLFSKM